MPATSACPICGGELKHSELRLHRNIIYCDTGAASLGPTELTIVNALLSSPGGIETEGLGERTGLDAHGVNVTVIRLSHKLSDMGWGVPNIGCGGRGGALYVLKRKW